MAHLEPHLEYIMPVLSLSPNFREVSFSSECHAIQQSLYLTKTSVIVVFSRSSFHHVITFLFGKVYMFSFFNFLAGWFSVSYFIYSWTARESDGEKSELCINYVVATKRPTFFLWSRMSKSDIQSINDPSYPIQFYMCAPLHPPCIPLQSDCATYEPPCVSLQFDYLKLSIASLIE